MVDALPSAFHVLFSVRQDTRSDQPAGLRLVAGPVPAPDDNGAALSALVAEAGDALPHPLYHIEAGAGDSVLVWYDPCAGCLMAAADSDSDPAYAAAGAACLDLDGSVTRCAPPEANSPACAAARAALRGRSEPLLARAVEAIKTQAAGAGEELALAFPAQLFQIEAWQILPPVAPGQDRRPAEYIRPGVRKRVRVPLTASAPSTHYLQWTEPPNRLGGGGQCTLVVHLQKGLRGCIDALARFTHQDELKSFRNLQVWLEPERTSMCNMGEGGVAEARDVIGSVTATCRFLPEAESCIVAICATV